MLKLFENANSDSDVDLKTNNEYANNYNDWRKKEVLYRCTQIIITELFDNIKLFTNIFQ